MKHSSFFKASLVVLVSVINLLMPQKVSAQSTVYFFMRKIYNTELDVYQMYIILKNGMLCRCLSSTLSLRRL